MTFTCPVCFYDRLDEAPADYNICDCCGTEFGSDDEARSYAQLRDLWISRGAKWFFRDPPLMWNPWTQLANANVALPYLSDPTVFVSRPARFVAGPNFTYRVLPQWTASVFSSDELVPPREFGKAA